jgi:rubrerythrin
MIPGFGFRKKFSDLSEKEILALAISSEEDDAAIYRNYAEHLKNDYPDTSKIFYDMARVEDSHRKLLLDNFKKRFDDNIPLIRRDHVSGFYNRKPIWLMKNLSINRIRLESEMMERDAHNFYMKAAQMSTDASTRKLLGDLAAAEAGHTVAADNLIEKHTVGDTKEIEARTAKRQFILTWVQPGLAGLMDGSVSTLAPIFATAFATQDTWTTFVVGLAASVGAGISMGLTEAVSDDGVISGRGSPAKRGLACGIMTAVGGLGHALPYLIPHFWTATILAMFIVFFELWAIVWIQNKYMEAPFLRATLQVVVGGGLVLAAGVLIGTG